MFADVGSQTVIYPLTSCDRLGICLWPICWKICKQQVASEKGGLISWRGEIFKSTLEPRPACKINRKSAPPLKHSVQGPGSGCSGAAIQTKKCSELWNFPKSIDSQMLEQEKEERHFLQLFNNNKKSPRLFVYIRMRTCLVIQIWPIQPWSVIFFSPDWQQLRYIQNCITHVACLYFIVDVRWFWEDDHVRFGQENDRYWHWMGTEKKRKTWGPKRGNPSFADRVGS